jgi:GNAT superfamily N-acetyltransferase
MSSHFVIRPYRATDEAGLLACWNAAVWADPIDALTWRGRYLLDPNFAPDTTPVAVDPASGDVVGFVHGYVDRSPAGPGADAWVVAFGVREDRRRSGIGTALMMTFEEAIRAAGAGRALYGPYIPSYLTPGIDVDAYADGVAFLTAIGVEAGGRPLSMKANLTNYRPEPTVGEREASLAGEGIAIRRAEPADILPLIAFQETHFPHWKPDAIGVMRDLFGGDPRGVTLHVATDDGEIIGYAQTRAERFGPFGVNEAYRGRGVGAVLLSRALRAMRAQGFHSAWFLWTSDRTARLYHQHGFEEVRRFVMMSKTFQTSEP